MLIRATLAAILLAGCGSPPGPPDPASFDWAVALSDLDDAILAVCSGGDRLLAVGGDADRAAVYEWRGDEWLVPALPAESGLLWWCWVGDDGEAYAVGEDLTVLSSTTTGAWTRETIGSQHAASDVTLYGVWGRGPDDLVAVGGSLAPNGDRGVVLERRPSGWQRVRDERFPDQVLFKAWSSLDGALWIVGAGGAILTRDAGGWRPVASPSGERLIAVWGTSASDVYAVGGDGQGLVLRYDGVAWSVFDRPPVRVSGVYTSANRPLYIAGDRGFVGRYRQGVDGRASSGLLDVGITLDGVDLHGLSSANGVVIATGADLLGGGPGAWRGALLTHLGGLGGSVDREPVYDAAVYDARLWDAAAADAGPAPGIGELCALTQPNCQPGVECWGLVESDQFICTERCEDASECTNPGYGPSPCCAIPGFQTLQTVCIPGNRAECL